MNYTTDTSELMCFPPQNPNLARSNHRVRGLLSRESVSSYSETISGLGRGRRGQRLILNVVTRFIVVL